MSQIQDTVSVSVSQIHIFCIGNSLANSQYEPRCNIINTFLQGLQHSGEVLARDREEVSSNGEVALLPILLWQKMIESSTCTIISHKISLFSNKCICFVWHLKYSCYRKIYHCTCHHSLRIINLSITIPDDIAWLLSSLTSRQRKCARIFELAKEHDVPAKFLPDLLASIHSF